MLGTSFTLIAGECAVPSVPAVWASRAEAIEKKGEDQRGGEGGTKARGRVGEGARVKARELSLRGPCLPPRSQTVVSGFRGVGR